MNKEKGIDKNKDKKAVKSPKKIVEKIKNGYAKRVAYIVKHAPVFKFLNSRMLANMSVRKQLLIPIVTIIAIVGIAGGSFSYFYGAKLIKDQLTQSTMAQLNSTDLTFETYFDDAQSITRQFTMSKMLDHVQKNTDDINVAFQNVLSSNTKYQAITYATADKHIVRAPLYFFQSSYDPTAESWYKAGVTGNGKSVWTNPYIDKVTKQKVVSVEQAVVDNGQVKGVIKLD
ncbi:MAG: methyl-accepting chemotaxis protein, partial [Sporolactobacillus laevolacticus]|nr:methyl-accepting chemotaxis protein [Sporolactobacillus laevolacticus]